MAHQIHGLAGFGIPVSLMGGAMENTTSIGAYTANIKYKSKTSGDDDKRIGAFLGMKNLLKISKWENEFRFAYVFSGPDQGEGSPKGGVQVSERLYWRAISTFGFDLGLEYEGKFENTPPMEQMTNFFGLKATF